MIYATEYDHATALCTGSSVDSGFGSLQEVIDTFGEDDLNCEHPRMVLFQSGEHSVAYSDFVFCIDEPDTIN